MKRWARAGMVGLVFLTACGAPAGQPRQEVLVLRHVQEAAQRGEIGTVEGYLYLTHPAIPIPLRDSSVTLIPLPPALEAAVARAKDQFLARGRVPLSASALDLARRPITDYIKRLQAAGHTGLTRTVQTESGPDPKFTFQDVAQGRWLLLAGLPSTISVLLWAVPVTVTSGEATRQSLNDTNIWLEGLTH